MVPVHKKLSCSMQTHRSAAVKKVPVDRTLVRDCGKIAWEWAEFEKIVGCTTGRCTDDKAQA